MFTGDLVHDCSEKDAACVEIVSGCLAAVDRTLLAEWPTVDLGAAVHREGIIDRSRCSPVMRNVKLWCEEHCCCPGFASARQRQ